MAALSSFPWAREVQQWCATECMTCVFCNCHFIQAHSVSSMGSRRHLVLIGVALQFALCQVSYNSRLVLIDPGRDFCLLF